ncbi:hypothetical protein MRX96_048516 [Rhipicephalus microplus]
MLRIIQTVTLLTPFLLNCFHRSDTPPHVTVFCATCNYWADLNHLCWEHPLYILPRFRALATTKRMPWPSLQTWTSPEPSAPDHAIQFMEALIVFFQDSAAPWVGDRHSDSRKIQFIQAAPLSWLYEVR